MVEEFSDEIFPSPHQKKHCYCMQSNCLSYILVEEMFEDFVNRLKNGLWENEIWFRPNAYFNRANNWETHNPKISLYSWARKNNSFGRMFEYISFVKNVCTCKHLFEHTKNFNPNTPKTHSSGAFVDVAHVPKHATCFNLLCWKCLCFNHSICNLKWMTLSMFLLRITCNS